MTFTLRYVTLRGLYRNGDAYGLLANSGGTPARRHLCKRILFTLRPVIVWSLLGIQAS